MPLLGGLFNKRDRQNSSSRNVVQSTATGSVASFASTRDSTDADYVFPDKSLPPPPPIYNLPAAASSSKLKLPFRRKQVTQPDPRDTPHSVVSLNDGPSPPHTSSVTSDSGHGLPPPPPRASIFGVYNESAQSTHSLPNETSNHHFDTPSRSSSFDIRSDSSPPLPPTKKSAGIFSWARERTKSKPPHPSSTTSSVASTNPSPEDSSFNLKSFRHIRAEPTHPSPERPAQNLSSSSLAPPQPRPRENSTASDSSQRISVAAFREAQARRANSPVSAFRPPSTAATLRLDVTGRKRASTVSAVSPDYPQQKRMPPAPMPGSRPDSSALQTSSSDESASEDDEEVDSDGEPIPKPGRKRTITRVNGSRARSDAGHSSAHNSINDVAQTRLEPPRLPKAESTLKNQSDLLSARQRASVSTSAATPNAAARRASILAAANSSLGIPAPPKPPAPKLKDDDSESSDTSDSDSEGLPLSGLIPPRRPGSSASNQSAGRARMPTKPLIDINSLVGGPPLLTPILRHEDSVKNLNRRDPDKDEPFSVPAALLSTSPSPTVSPPSASSQFVNKQTAPPVNKSMSPSHQRRPSSEVSAAPKTKAPENDDDLMNAIRLVNSLDEALEPSESQSKPTSDRIVPTPIREREPPTSFTVLSRPPHRQSTAEASASLSPVSQSHPQPQPQPQPPSVSSPPALPTQPALSARQRASSAVSPPPQNDKSDTISVVSAARSSASRSSSRVPPVPLIHSIPDSPSVKQDWKPSRPRSTSRSSAYHTPERYANPPPMPSSTSSNMLSSGYQPSLMPHRPFASNSSLRGESPAGSSTGDSSSGRTPFTPRDGSDIGVRSRDDGSDVGSTLKARGHAKKPSVTFEDSQPIRGRERSKTDLTDEQRTRERRRSEAKAAIELGKIVNGRGPLHDSDEDVGMGARNPTINVTAIGMENSAPGMAAPGWAPWQQPMATGMGPMLPPQFGNDPAFIAAHQRALLIAKQAYQMAVAQHAMQLAGEEWERSSNVGGFGSGGSVYGGGGGGSVYGGGSGGSVYGGGSGGSVYGGVGGGLGAGMAPMGMMGMPMLMPPNQWSRSSVMFPSATASVYGGISSSQSEFGGGGGWGSRSAYGDSFGASSRSSYMSSGVPNSSASAYGGGSRPRARTGVNPPSSGSSGLQARTPGKSPARKAPPSSWKNGR